MSKYLFGFKLYFLNSFNYRFNAVINLLFGGLGLLVTLLFWHLIYGGDTTIALNGFTFSSIATYFIVGSIFRPNYYPGFTISNMIKTGTLGPALLKPRNLGLHIYFNNIANIFTGMIPQAVLVLCMLPFAARFLTWELSMFNAGMMVLFFVVGTVSNFLVWTLVGYMAFWLTEAQAIMWSFAVLCNFLTGFFIPLAFFPDWSVPVLEMLPFSSWSYIPMMIYIGLFDAGRQVFLLAVHLTWVAVLLAVTKMVWQRGVRKFTSVGG